MTNLPEHHPAIAAVGTARITQPPGFVAEFGGALTRVEYGGAPGARWSAEMPLEVTTALPAVDDEYFEWISLLEAVADAESAFTMVELGAGYGRWSVRGAMAARGRGLPFQCVAVEAEPTHCRWLRQHLRDNGVDPNEQDVIWAAVAEESGIVPFRVGRPDRDYGQNIEERAARAIPDARARRRLRARAALGRPPALVSGETMWVVSVTLSELLAPHYFVDLVDMDIQGAELRVVAEAIHRLDARVRRVHVGTHTTQVEHGLREVFRDHGWELLDDFPCAQTVETRYGPVTFEDGVQRWLNPRATRSANAVIDKHGRSVRPDSAYDFRALRQKIAELRAENERLRRGRKEAGRAAATGERERDG